MIIKIDAEKVMLDLTYEEFNLIKKVINDVPATKDPCGFIPAEKKLAEMAKRFNQFNLPE